MGECIVKRIPWFTYLSVGKLETLIKGHNEVLEWGAGGSTLWWLDRGCDVTTVDHETTWVETVRRHVRPDQLRRWHPFVVPAERMGSPEHASGMRPGFFFKAYSLYPSTLGRKWDVVSVDGRARVACLRQAGSLLRSGGLLILDNSDRAAYAKGLTSFADWKRLDFFGPGPESAGVHWMTTFMFKPED